jgi:nucleotide sugar dehydrogenase
MELSDFHIAYSPERISPGDDAHTLRTTTKILAASNQSKEDQLAALYESFLTEETHKTPTIRVAEAAKVIENTQRDLNIALMNELSQLFTKIGIDTSAVIEAAATKWNFHEYFPGLVGGHCIGVDPYYLTYKAQQEGYDPKVILAGRSINDRMYEQAVEMLLKGLNEFEKVPKQSTVLILGLTYKENVDDARNSKLKPLIDELEEYGVDVRVLDPVLGEDRIEELGYKSVTDLDEVTPVDGVVNAVPHDNLSHLTLTDLKAAMNGPIMVDVRDSYDEDEAVRRGFYYRSF